MPALTDGGAYTERGDVVVLQPLQHRLQPLPELLHVHQLGHLRLVHLHHRGLVCSSPRVLCTSQGAGVGTDMLKLKYVRCQQCVAAGKGGSSEGIFGHIWPTIFNQLEAEPDPSHTSQGTHITEYNFLIGQSAAALEGGTRHDRIDLWIHL